MTTPIPEAAVEAAREAVHTSECGCSSRVHGPYTWDWYDEIARATLTAALPLMEAQALREAAENFQHCPDYGYRVTRWRATEDDLNNRAATITERTQR